MTTPIHYTDYPTKHVGDNATLDHDTKGFSSRYSKALIDPPEDDSFDSTRLGTQQNLRRGPSAKSSASDGRFTYIDEDFNYYPSRPHKPSAEDNQDASLVHNAAQMDRSGGGYQDLGTL
jgi:hypothetical protein